MKNQKFSPRTLPQLPATFPELSGTATELSGATQKLSGGAPGPARAESGWPQNWSPARIFQNTSFKRGFSEEINISNHRPKSFLSLMEDAHQVLAANRKVIFPLPALAREETGRPQNWSPAFFVCIYNDFLISLTQVNLYEDVSLSSRKISAYDCLYLSLVGKLF